MHDETTSASSDEAEKAEGNKDMTRTRSHWDTIKMKVARTLRKLTNHVAAAQKLDYSRNQIEPFNRESSRSDFELTKNTPLLIVRTWKTYLEFVVHKCHLVPSCIKPSNYHFSFHYHLKETKNRGPNIRHFRRGNTRETKARERKTDREREERGREGTR